MDDGSTTDTADAIDDLDQLDTGSESGRSDIGLDDESCDDRPLWRDVVGDVLRDERLDQNRTLADVARDAAVSLPYLSEIERGRKEVSSDVLDAVIRSLGLDLADVLERAADRLRPVDADLRVIAIRPGVEHLQGNGGLSAPRGQWGGAQARLAA